MPNSRTPRKNSVLTASPNKPDNIETIAGLLQFARILANSCERIQYGNFANDSRRIPAKDIGKLVSLVDILHDMAGALDARQV